MAVLPLRFYGDPDNNNNTNNNHLAATATTQLTSTARQIINSSNDCNNNNNETADILHFPVPVLLLLLHRLLSISQVVLNARRRHQSSFIHQLCPSDCKTFSTIRND
jgi:hypothetical protein